MKEKNNLVQEWLISRWLKFILKWRYKHLDYKPAIRNISWEKIQLKWKNQSQKDMDLLYIQVNKKNTRIVDFLIDFLNPENICKRKFLPFLLWKKPKFKISWIQKMNSSDKWKKKITKKEYRPIMWASHFDSIIYRYLGYIWWIKYENYIEKNKLHANVIAYRSIYDEELKIWKNNINYAVSSFKFIQKEKDVVAAVFDVSKFFENLDHWILKENLLKVLNQKKLEDFEYIIYKRLTKYSYLDVEDIRKNIKTKKRVVCSAEEMKSLLKDWKIKIFHNKSNKWIPQGSPLSGLLANIYMIDFDKEIKELCEKGGFYYSRYSDDIIIIGKESQLIKIRNILLDKISKLTNLEIKNNKTKYVFFKNGKCIKSITYKNEKQVINIKNPKLEYLGCEFNWTNVGIKSGSLSRFYQKLSKKIKKYRFAKRWKKIVIRKTTYPTIGKKSNFWRYIRGALRRVKNNFFIKKQFSRHISFTSKGFRLPKKKEKK